MLVVRPVEVERVAASADVALLVERRDEAASFDRFRPGLDSGELANGGEDVVADGGLAGDRIGFNAGTGDDEGDADTGFPDGGFAAAEGAVDIAGALDGESAIVRREDDIGVVRDTGSSERVEELPDGFIHVSDHGSERNVVVTGAGGR